MRYTVIASTNCTGGTCPTIYNDATREDDVIVQGFTLTAEQMAELAIPGGETAVRIPRSLIERAARHG